MIHGCTGPLFFALLARDGRRHVATLADAAAHADYRAARGDSRAAGGWLTAVLAYLQIVLGRGAAARAA